MRGDPPLIGGAKAQDMDYRRKAPLAASERGALRRDARRRRTRRLAIIGASSCTSPAPLSIRLQVRPSRRVVLVAAGVAAAAAAAFALFTSSAPRRSSRLAPWHARAREGARRAGAARRRSSTFPGPTGKIEGLDADLLRLFAAEKKLRAALRRGRRRGEAPRGARRRRRSHRRRRPAATAAARAAPCRRGRCGPTAPDRAGGRRRAVVTGRSGYYTSSPC